MRTDIVFDVYRPSSLQAVNFLADNIARVTTPNVVIVTKEEDAVSNRTLNLAGMAPCCYEEADMRISVHARHATEAGSKVIMVKARHRHSRTPAVVGCLWPRTDLRWVHANGLCCTLSAKSKGMLFFHAFTGCDVASALPGDLGEVLGHDVRQIKHS
ncbi:hypothetical protein Pcinc_003138 [Petrolisthes cinctipes]|uniref:Uncharacterized protein n=1 Tax=Petrolisthes cinctipes TaxID=88211 RepID=A0AAE1L1J3_PETCI|nr:hypothetical protein Pcinc_003138 [Petrolisthes cinctipes]